MAEGTQMGGGYMNGHPGNINGLRDLKWADGTSCPFLKIKYHVSPRHVSELLQVNEKSANVN
jgi:hypothetical protein